MSTRGVLAILVAVCLLLGVAAARRGGSLGSWLLGAGLLGAAVWSGLGVAWAATRPASIPATTFLSLFAMALAGAIYLLDRARRGLPPT